MDDYLRYVVGLNWADRPYRAVVWVSDDQDDPGHEALRSGYIEPIVREEGGVLARITALGMSRIDAQFSIRRAA